MFKWLKSFFVEKAPIQREIITMSYAPLEYNYSGSAKCKIHWEYNGLALPTNNCNVCWEYYSKKSNKKW